MAFNYGGFVDGLFAGAKSTTDLLKTYDDLYKRQRERDFGDDYESAMDATSGRPDVSATSTPYPNANPDGSPKESTGSGTQGTEGTYPTGMSPAEVKAYILRKAEEKGVDPNVAHQLVGSEGGYDINKIWQSNEKRPDGSREKSYGPFQLNVDSKDSLGSQFQRDTGLDPADKANLYAGIDYALDHASRNGWGAWSGSRRIGLDPWAGIGQNFIPTAPMGVAGSGFDTSKSAMAAAPVPTVAPGPPSAAPTTLAAPGIAPATAAAAPPSALNSTPPQAANYQGTVGTAGTTGTAGTGANPKLDRYNAVLSQTKDPNIAAAKSGLEVGLFNGQLLPFDSKTGTPLIAPSGSSGGGVDWTATNLGAGDDDFRTALRPDPTISPSPSSGDNGPDQGSVSVDADYDPSKRRFRDQVPRRITVRKQVEF